LNLEEAKCIPISAVREKISHVQINLHEGANAVDYVRAYLKATGEDHTEFDILRWMNNMFGDDTHLPKINAMLSPKDEKKNIDWRIMQEFEIEDVALIRYLERRGINIEIAKRYLKEVYIRNRKQRQSMYALGFKNEDNGFSVINPFIDVRIGRQEISFIRCGKFFVNKVHVFSNFMDMLAAFSAFPDLPKKCDVICLNDPELLPLSFVYLKKYSYKKIYSWMPNSKPGADQINRLTDFVRKEQGVKHLICNDIYRKFVDVLSWRISENKTA
jgi:hypothetical protein